MRSQNITDYFKTITLSAALAAAALMISPTGADARAVDALNPTIKPYAVEQAVKVAAATREDARSGRRAMRDDLRQECHASHDNRRARRSCVREGMQGHRNAARAAQRECRQSGGSRAECAQQRRDYWANGSLSGGSSGGETSGSNDRGDD